MKSIKVLLLMMAGIVSGCASNQNETTVNTHQASQAQIPTNVSLDVDILESGITTPKYNGNMVIGYEYKGSFAIPAQLKSGFGFSYKAIQKINITADESNSATSEVLSQLPIKITVTHPPMKQANGSETTSTSWNDTLYFNRTNYATWLFENASELVAGNWVMTIYYNNEKIAQRAYLVMLPKPKIEKLTAVCRADESLYPPRLAQDHKACCEDGDADACYNFAWRGVERQKDITGAILYYGRSCDLGSASGCRTAGNLAESKEEKEEWFNKGCDLKDLDSCLEVDRLPY